MGVKLVSASAGSVEIVAPATASNYTATMPAGSGTVAVNGVSGSIVSGTAVASTSGTSIDFTGIPSWVKRVTVMYRGISTTSTSPIQIQLGAGSVSTSGYATESWTANTNNTNYSSGFILRTTETVAAGSFSGKAEFCLLGSNIWVGSGVCARTEAADITLFAGTITLGGTLDRVRITTIGGTATFDAGSINILYE